MKKQSYSHVHRFVAFISSQLFLVLLLVACGSFPSTGGERTPTPGKTISPERTATSEPTTVPMPATQTSCPPSGVARSAVMPPLVLGSHQSIIYLTYQGGINIPSPSILQRYDITTGSTTEILRMPNTRITEAQVSADGQWILFVAGSKLQLIRMDGQALQTLYCASGSTTYINSVQWSPDQRQVMFHGGGKPGGVLALYLLDIVRGVVQLEMANTGPSTFYLPRTWIDTKRVYLVAEPTPVQVPKLYILDTTKGANQHTNNLQFVAQAQSPYCWDFDSSYDTGKLFLDHCLQFVLLGQAGVGLRQGPSEYHCAIGDWRSIPYGLCQSQTGHCSDTRGWLYQCSSPLHYRESERPAYNC